MSVHKKKELSGAGWVTITEYEELANDKCKFTAEIDILKTFHARD